jgi:hypothetical protein
MQMDEGDARLLEPMTARIIFCAFKPELYAKLHKRCLAHTART